MGCESSVDIEGIMCVIEGNVKTIAEVLCLDITSKNVLVIGIPASGKTYLTNSFETDHKKIHLDEYRRFGYKQSIYHALNHLKQVKEFTIIEGVQGYRLLRKGVELNCYYPHIVIQLIITVEQMIITYLKEREQRKIPYLKGFNKANDRILSDYFKMKNKSVPELWITVHNKHEIG